MTETETEFTYVAADDLARELISELGAGFAVRQTDHFVICSNASTRYTDYCGRLLEHVHAQFVDFMQSCEVAPQPLSTRLPVIIFRSNAEFQDFAAAQHPETDFSDVPGYYSVRDNQMLISALSGDQAFRSNSDVIRELKKKPRQVETIVHEAVHQLAFNTGIQTRYAENPTWLSEGLAVYFEEASQRGTLIWSRPGSPSEIHLPGFQNAARSGMLRLPLADLLKSDTAFQSNQSLADAYAESWALVYYLIRSDRAAFGKLLKRLQHNRPLVPMSADMRVKAVTEAVGKDVDELEAAVIAYMRRVRTR